MSDALVRTVCFILFVFELWEFNSLAAKANTWGNVLNVYYIFHLT